MELNRRDVLAAGAAVAAVAAAPKAAAQQTGLPGTTKFYQRGNVKIAYQEVGTGFPLLVIPGGGLNSRMAGLVTSPFNPIAEFSNEFRVSTPICAMRPKANPPARSRSTGRGIPTPTITSA